MEHEKTVFWIYMCALMAVLMYVLEVSSAEPDTGLWLARSCVGEAGFHSGRSGECAAIGHIYQKRSEAAGVDFYSTMRAYSSAIKPRGNKNRQWVFDLRRDGSEPLNWPKNLNWLAYRADWMHTLNTSDMLIRGLIPDPLPRAEHYEGWVDRHRIPTNWIRIKTKFRNRFYRVESRD